MLSATPDTFTGSYNYQLYGYDYNLDLPGLVPAKSSLVPSINTTHMAYPRQLSRVRFGADALLVADGVNGTVSFSTCGIRSAITGPTGSEFDVVAEQDHQNRHPKGIINCLMCDGSVSPRQWVYSKTEMPIPSEWVNPANPATGTNPALFPLFVQKFWFGHVPNSNGD